MSEFSLPSLYFQEKGHPFVAGGSSSSSSSSNDNDIIELPCEMLHKAVSEYLIWGDLAKLSNTQKGWKNTMYDAANSTPENTWNLACALFEGSHGLAINTIQAVQLLEQLVQIEIDITTKAPISVEEESQDSSSVQQNMTADDNIYATKAMKKLAHFYLENEDSIIDNNTSTGLAWLKCAFNHGNDIDSAHEIALIYEYGQYNVETDVVAAAEWFEIAANNGHVEAMAELGLCYELGCGVEVNDEIALDWYMKAATAGHITAKYSVGEAFEEARGVPKSDEEACLWYYKAAIEGDEDSRKALRRLEDIARIVVPGVRALLDG